MYRQRKERLIDMSQLTQNVKDRDLTKFEAEINVVILIIN